MKTVVILQRKIFLKDIIIATIIVALPFLFYLYRLAPETKVWETLIFRIDSNYYEGIDVFFWTLANKLLTLLILLIWFVTCKHWWRFAIIVPIIIECYKFLSILNDDLRYVDEFEFVYSLPLTIPLILFLVFLSKKLNYYSLSKSLNNELNDEINSLMNEFSNFKTEDYKIIRKELNGLRDNKSVLDKEEYLKQLIVLRKKLIEV